MNYDDNIEYEEAIGLDVEDDGRIWIEHQADELKRLLYNARHQHVFPIPANPTEHTK